MHEENANGENAAEEESPKGVADRVSSARAGIKKQTNREGTGAGGIPRGREQ